MRALSTFLCTLLLFMASNHGCVAPSPDSGPYFDDAELDGDSGVNVALQQQALQTGLCGNMAGLQANSPWPMRGGCPTHAAQSSAYGPPAATENWVHDFLWDVRTSPAIAADGTIYIGSDDGRFYALDPTTGATQCSFLVWDHIRSSPAIGADGTIYVGSNENRLHAFNPVTRQQKWAYVTGSAFANAAVTASPVIGADGTIYVGSHNGKFYAINPNGTRKWEYATGASIQSSAAIGPDNTIYFGSDDNWLYALNPDGTLKWNRDLLDDVGTPAVGPFGHLYVNCSDGKLHALDAQTGTPLWERYLGWFGGWNTPAIDKNGVVYIGGGDWTLYAYTPDGVELWKYLTLGPIISSATIDRAGNVYFGSDDDGVYALNSAGELLWRYQTWNNVQGSPVITATGAVLVGSDDNKLYSLGVGGPPPKAAGDLCSEDTECAPGLLCGEENGDRFGHAAGTRACWPPSCQNGFKDVDEDKVDCGGPCGTCDNVCAQPCALGEQVPPDALDTLSFESGYFIRGSLATYTDHEGNILRATAHQLRYTGIENNKRMALFEGERTNTVIRSEELGTIPGWFVPDFLSGPPIELQIDAGSAPDGMSSADKLLAPSGGIPATIQLAANPNGPGTFSAYLKNAGASPGKTRLILFDPVVSDMYSDAEAWDLPAQWTRFDKDTQPASIPLYLAASHVQNYPAGLGDLIPALPAADYYLWGIQWEEGSFPSSYLPTNDQPRKRNADRLIYPASQVPNWMRTSMWQFDVMPLHASDELTDGEEFVLFSFGGPDDVIALVKDGGEAHLRVRTEGAVRFDAVLAWERKQRMTVTIDPATGTLTVAGAELEAASTAQAFSFPIVPLRIGGAYGGMSEAFAGMSEPRAVADAQVDCAADLGCVVCGDGVLSAGEQCDTATDPRCANDCSAIGEVKRCNEDSDCGPGRICGEANGSRYGLEATARVCQPNVGCPAAEGPLCGGLDKPCGFCECIPDCVNKACGDDPSDGCGGVCKDLCGYHDPGGCQSNTDCQGGLSCGFNQGFRFGLPFGTNVCWDGAICPFSTQNGTCGDEASPCGVCLASCEPKCAGKSCGESDECGGVCRGADANCPGGETCNQHGECVAAAIPKGRDIDITARALGNPDGSFGVAQDGAATYVVPIQVPPGSAGLTPRLALSYNSNGGASSVGHGWSLTGLSTIERCPKRVATHDVAEGVTYANSDAFCLDGQPIVAVSGQNGTDGAEYRTRLDSFRRIVSHSPGGGVGPTSFTVWTKTGLRMEYGGVDATVFYDRDTGKGRAWYLRRIVSRSGVIVEYEYASTLERRVGGLSTTEFHLSAVKYGFREDAPLSSHVTPFSVRLNYERTSIDNRLGFRYGTPVVRTKRLASITTSYLGLSTVREYKLTHEAFDNGWLKLTSVQECAGHGQRQECKQPTAFNYKDIREADLFENDVPGYYDSRSDPLQYGAVPPGAQLHVLDANGDGKDDLAYVGQYGGWELALSSDPLVFIDTGTTTTAVRAAPLEVALEHVRHGGVQGGDIPRQHVGDYDGDGRDDILELSEDLTKITVLSLSVQEDSFASRVTPSQGLTGTNILDTWSLDIDGDGDLDFLVAFAYQGDQTAWIQWFINVGSSSVIPGSIFEERGVVEFYGGLEAATVGDFDANGSQEILTSFASVGSVGPGGNPVVRGGENLRLIGTHPDQDGNPQLAWRHVLDEAGQKISFPGLVRLQTVDVNGDALPDTIVVLKSGGAVLLSTGESTRFRVSNVEEWLYRSGATFWGNDGVFAVDFNLDGRDDLAAYSSDYGDEHHVRAYRAGQNWNEIRQVCPDPSSLEGSCTRAPDGTVQCSGCVQGQQPIHFDAGWCYRYENGCSENFDHASRNGATVESECLELVCLVEWSSYTATECPFGTICSPSCDAAIAALSCYEHNQRIDDSGVEERIPVLDLGIWRAVYRADLDGNGVSDLVLIDNTGQVYTRRHRLDHRLLTSIAVQATSELRSGSRTLITYELGVGAAESGTYLLTDAEDDACASSSVEAAAPRRPVVSSAETDGPGRQTYNVYKYYDGRYHRAVGWLGFSRIENQERDPLGHEQVRNSRWTQYGQACLREREESQPGVFYPYVGLVTQQYLEWDQGTANDLLFDGTGDEVRREGTARTLRMRHSADGVPYVYTNAEFGFTSSNSETRARWVRTGESPDGYGNMEKVTTFHADGRTRVVDAPVSVTSERRAAWHIGLVDDIEVTDRLADGSEKVLKASYIYDEVSGLLDSETVDPGGAYESTTSYVRDDWGNVEVTTVSDQDPETPDRQLTQVYDMFGVWPKTVTNAKGHVTEQEFYYAHGALASVQDPNAIVQEWEYDAFGRLLESRLSSSTDGTLTTTYDWHEVSSDTSESGWGLHTSYEVTVTRPDQSHLFLAFDAAGSVVRRIWDDALGTGVVRQEFEYDDYGRPRRVSRPHRPGATGSDEQGHVTYHWDNIGRLTAEEGADGQRWRRLRYEVLHESTLAGDVDFEEARHFDVTQEVDPKGNVTTSILDGQGRPVWIRDPALGVTRYEYGHSGSLSKITDTNDNLTEIDVDQFGRPILLLDPDMGEVVRVYDALGDLRRVTVNGEITDFTYDELGRLTGRSNQGGGQSGSASWGWDEGLNARGKLSSISTQSHRKDIFYEGRFGLPDSWTETYELPTQQVLVETAVGYDAQLRLEKLTYPGGLEIEYEYSPTSELVGVVDLTHGQQLWQATSFYQGMLLEDESFGSGVDVSYEYEQLTGALHARTSKLASGSQFARSQYHYDLNMNVDLVHRDGLAPRTYEYDELNRLTGVVEHSNGAFNEIESFEYDSIGNVTSSMAIGDYSYERLPGEPVLPHAQPHALRKAGGNTYGYDASGNQFWRRGPDIGSGPDGYQVLQYDTLNRLIAIDGTDVPGGPLQEMKRFDYDADGQLVYEKSGAREVFFAGKLYQRHFSAGVLDEEVFRVYAGARAIAEIRVSDASGETSTQFLHTDHIGSPEWVSHRDEPNQDASVRELEPFSAFGYQEVPEDLALGYTGHRNLSTGGLIHAGGRVYDSRVGRFLSADPLVQAPFYSQSLNRYSYVFNNPINYIDPTGFFACNGNPNSCVDDESNNDGPIVRIWKWLTGLFRGGSSGDNGPGQQPGPAAGGSGITLAEDEVLIDEVHGPRGPGPAEPQVSPPSANTGRHSFANGTFNSGGLTPPGGGGSSGSRGASDSGNYGQKGSGPSKSPGGDAGHRPTASEIEAAYTRAYEQWWEWRPERFRTWGPISNWKAAAGCGAPVCADYAEAAASFMNQSVEMPGTGAYSVWDFEQPTGELGEFEVVREPGWFTHNTVQVFMTGPDGQAVQVSEYDPWWRLW